MIWLIVAALLALCAGFLGGWTLRGRQLRRHIEEMASRIERIEPSSRTPGQPTNVGQPFSRVTRGKYRRRMMQDGDAQE